MCVNKQQTQRAEILQNDRNVSLEPCVHTVL